MTKRLEVWKVSLCEQDMCIATEILLPDYTQAQFFFSLCEKGNILQEESRQLPKTKLTIFIHVSGHIQPNTKDMPVSPSI